MNSSILKKCIEELQQENFRKDYVLGMLETLYEMQQLPEIKIAPPIMPQVGSPLPVVQPEVGAIDEAAILDRKAREAIASVQAMGKLEDGG